MVSIYRIYNERGLSYIGSTTQPLKRRYSEHKSKSRIIKNSAHLIFKESKFVKIELLDSCSIKDRFKKENEWMGKFKNKTNKCIAWQGPKGFKRSARHIDIARKIMKNRWMTDRESVCAQINRHKTKEFQKMASAASHKKKYETMPVMIVSDAVTRMIIGSYKTHNELAKILKIKSRKTIYRLMRGQGIFANKFIFERSSL